MKSRKKVKKGFTLAETLITMAVIGVVASLTVPTLMKEWRNKSYVAGLKKFYSTGNQAVKMMAIEAGTPGDLKTSGIFTSYLNVGEAFAAQFKVVKNCGLSNNQDCWAPFNYNYDGSSGSNSNLNKITSHYKFVTSDGMSISVSLANTYNCNTDYGVDSNSPTTKTCGSVLVDVNGKKGPNLKGRDVFSFHITSNKAPLIYPHGGYEDDFAGSGITEGGSYWNYNDENKCSASNTNGYYCTGRVLGKGTMDY